MSFGVAIFHHDQALAEDVADAVDRTDGLHLVAVNETKPGIDVALAGGRALKEVAPGPALVVLSSGPSADDARAGFEAGARGWIRWPEDAADLAALVSSAGIGRVADPPGDLIVVAGARGGAGTTTLAALIASRARDALVIDLSGDGGQAAFSAEASPPEGLTRSLASPLPDVLEAAAAPHASGRALYAPFGVRTDDDDDRVAALVSAARRIAATVVVDVGRLRPDMPTWDGRFVVVLAGDVTSLRVARAFIDAGGSARFILNRTRRGSLRARHVERALGVAPDVVVEHSRALARAADLGRLPRSRMRDLAKVVAT